MSTPESTPESVAESVACARAITAALAAGGVRHVVYSPGSRDAPFAFTLAAAEDAGWLRAHVRVDERSAAFYALGLARAAELTCGAPAPVALVMTSGTAIANMHPAILEAAHACVPLVVISADRPATMRGTGANQTTDHLAVLAGTVRGSWDVASGPGTWAIARALEVARGGALPAGPVHVNVQLAPPLHDPEPEPFPTEPQVIPEDAPTGTRERLASRADVAPFIPVAPDAPATCDFAALGLDPEVPGVIVAGNQAQLARGADAIPALAARLGWPLLAEPASGLRVSPALTHYQQVLATRPDLAEGARQVLVVGHPTLSRPVTALLTDPGRRVVAVTRAGTATMLGGNVAALTACVPTTDHRANPQVAGWFDQWRLADEAVDPDDPREQWLARLWARHAQAGPRPPILVAGASLSIRALDRAGAVTDQAPDVLANRGLAGIDGTISFARGVAAASGRPVRAVVGDVTFTHDVGGLATGIHEPAEDVQVVVVNDAGGQIFSTLEYGQARETATYQRFFATPQRVAVAGIAAGFGWEYTVASSPIELDYVAATPVRGLGIVEALLAPGIDTTLL